MAKMTESEWKAFLVEKPRTGKLGTVRKDGRPHVAPIWFDLDDDGSIMFMTGTRTVKGHAIRRDPRVCLSVDDEAPPYSFVSIDGEVTWTTQDPDEMLPWSIRISARYVGVENGEAFGRRNAVPGEMLVRVTPTHVAAQKAIAE
jgi:PPOX class probable F420-dependent enzyme